MNKQFTKALALGLAAMMVLGGCGGASTETKAPEEASAEKPQQQQEQSEPEAKRELTEVVIPKIASSELETFNFLHSQRSEDAVVLLNLWDGLLTSNSRGEIIAAVADEWGTKDGGLTWKFHLRDGVKWVDVNANEKADCTAEDFATGLEWVLNFHKNESVNTSMPIEMIKGAEEYYEYTKTLSEEEARALTAGEGSKFREMVGMEIVDKNNIIYHCVSEKPYFDTLATSNCLYPLAQGLVDELGVDGVNAMNNENMWYNGAYTLTSYIQGNEKVFTKNPKYWDTESVRFDTATHRMVESWDTAYQLYQTGDVDYVKLTESMIKTISENPDHELYQYMVPDKPSTMSYQFHWNYAKNKEDGTPDMTPCTYRTTWKLQEFGLSLPPNGIQKICGFTIFPRDYFCPLDYYSGITQKTKNTYSIHHYEASWLDPKRKAAVRYDRRKNQLRHFLGPNIYHFLEIIWNLLHGRIKRN